MSFSLFTQWKGLWTKDNRMAVTGRVIDSRRISTWWVSLLRGRGCTPRGEGKGLLPSPDIGDVLMKTIRMLGRLKKHLRVDWDYLVHTAPLRSLEVD
jgi:hypothetical protein